MTPEIVRAIARNEAQAAAEEVVVVDTYEVSTTDATPTTIAAITLEDYQAGILEVKVLGLDDIGHSAVSIIQVVRYAKTAGALTFGTPANVLTLEDDFGAAAVAISDVSDNIEVIVTGAAANNINWVAEIKHLYLNNTVAP